MANRNLAHAVRVALVTAGAVSAGLYGVTSFAQEQLTEIIVTGSRIKISAEAETSQPVTVISRDDIETQGFQSVVDILQNITATGTPPLSRSSPLSAGEAAGGSYISLRNLGSSRTLILLNGRRLPVTTSGLADVSLIPASAIERVEVLKDGASSIYGSDAIAGVINIITRTNFDGFTATAYMSQYDEGDGETERVEFIMGSAGEKGSITVSGEWVSEGEVWAKDRPYSAFPRSSLHPTDGWTVAGQYGGFATSAAAGFTLPGYANNTRIVLRDGGNPLLLADYRAQNVVTGSCASSAGATINGCVPGQTADKSNTNEQTHLRTPLDRRSLNIDGVYELTDDVQIRTSLLYSSRTTERQVAGYPYQASSFATPMSATSYFNPTGQSIPTWWRRSWEVPRVSDSELTTYALATTLEGSFEAAGRDFDWDATYQHSVNNQVQATFGNLNLPNTLAAVGPSFLNAGGVVQCGTPTSPIPLGTCQPWNPYLPFGRAGQGGLTDNQALQDFLFQEEHAEGKTTTTIISANLTGSIVELPAGNLAFAAGVERREEAGQFVPDALAVAAQSTNLASRPTRGGYEVDEVYAELRIPLLADTFLAHRLNLNLASRYSDYDTFGDTTNSKIGLEWAPLPQLLFRGTWAEGFRAPTIADLYGGGSQTFSFFTDPCDTLFGSSGNNATTRANCVAAMGALANTYRQLAQGFVPAGFANAQTPVAFFQGVGNSDLQPETSVTKTAGFVWSPEWRYVDGLTAAFDWWHAKIESTIITDTATNILNDCFIQGLASRCTLFTRDAALGYVNNMFIGNRNAGYREVEGYDLTLSYAFKSAFGDFTLSSTTSYTEKDVLISTNDPRVPVSSVGTAASGGSVWRVRSNLNVGWQYGDFGATWGVRYYSPLEEACTYFFIDPANPTSLESNLECNSIKMRLTGAYMADGVTPAMALSRRNDSGANTFNDVQFRWQAPWDATIAIGANNVFDNTGPVMYSQPNANVSYNGAYDLDRSVYVKYTQRF